MEDSSGVEPSPPPPLAPMGNHTRKTEGGVGTPQRKKKVANLLTSILARERLGTQQWQHKFEEVLEYKTATSSRIHFNYNLQEPTKSTFVVAFSPDRTKIATLHGNHSINISDCFTFEILLTLKGHPRTPWCVAFHPHINSLLATGCLGGQVRLWDLNKMTQDDDNIIHQSQAVISSLTFHPTRDILAVSTHNKLLFYDWNKRIIVRSFQMKQRAQSIRLVRFLPNGNKLITAVANTSARYCKPERFNVSTRGDGSGNSVVETVSCMRLQRPNEDGDGREGSNTHEGRHRSRNVSSNGDGVSAGGIGNVTETCGDSGGNSRNDNETSSGRNEATTPSECCPSAMHSTTDASVSRKLNLDSNISPTTPLTCGKRPKLKRKGGQQSSENDRENSGFNNSSANSDKRRRRTLNVLNSYEFSVSKPGPNGSGSLLDTGRCDSAESKNGCTPSVTSDNIKCEPNNEPLVEFGGSENMNNVTKKVEEHNVTHHHTSSGNSRLDHDSPPKCDSEGDSSPAMRGSCSCPHPLTTATTASRNTNDDEETSSRSRPFYRRHRRRINLTDHDVRVAGQVSCEPGSQGATGNSVNNHRHNNNPPPPSSNRDARRPHGLSRSDLWQFHFRGSSAAQPATLSSSSSTNNTNMSVDSTGAARTTTASEENVSYPFSNLHQSTHVTNFLGVQTAVATATARSSHHVHTAVVIASREHENCEATLQTAVNRAIAGAFAGSGEGAVANNIIDTTHRLQLWDADVHLQVATSGWEGELLNEKTNIIVPSCKIHNDSSLDISQDSSYITVFVPNECGFPMDAEVKVLSLRPDTFLQCIYSRKFGPNAVSLSLSSLNNYLMVGLASRKLHWQTSLSRDQLIGQVLELPSSASSSEVNLNDARKPVLSVYHKVSRNSESQRSNVSVNTLRFHPTPGMGIVYGTNRGHVAHCHIEPDMRLMERKYVDRNDPLFVEMLRRRGNTSS